ncbi:MAG: Rrf2 family transcriptional regulator [Clostridia bacterium]|nr:Rrf2 family transcriptional regulator [Clostridia bacterium]
MKFSTKGRYGLRAVVELAARYGEGPVSLSAVAAEQGVSEAYLEQLMRSLKNAGLVSTARGKTGGYLLTKEPSEISVGEVLRALEGSTDVVDCVGSEANVCENACTCSARPLFLKLQSRINAVLDETTIGELTEDHIEQKKRIEHARLS